MEILEKRLTDFEKIIPYDALEPKEIKFLEEVLKPSMIELGFEYPEQKILLNRYKAIVENRTRYKSVFPAREFDRELIDVAGVRKTGNPDEMARKLVLGLISRKPEVAATSEEFYHKDVLSKIKDNISPSRMFCAVKDLILGEYSAKKTADLLGAIVSPEYSNCNDLNAIVNFIDGGIKDPSRFQDNKVLVTRTNERTIDLSISYGMYGCCAFWGSVERDRTYRKDLDSRYHASTLYLADPEIGLIFHHIENNGHTDIPTGVIISSSMIGRNLGDSKSVPEKVLLVDSIEAYRPDWDRDRFPNNPLREMNNDIWRRLTYNSIFQAAHDIGASKILYNRNFWNEGGNTFTNYLISRMENEKINFRTDETFHLRKEGARNYIPDYYVDNFGYFIDCLIPEDSTHYHGAHAVLGNMTCEGQAKVMAIDLR